jgi:hypothetical protein
MVPYHFFSNLPSLVFTSVLCCCIISTSLFWLFSFKFVVFFSVCAVSVQKHCCYNQINALYAAKLSRNL